jgi:hypothetical protein
VTLEKALMWITQLVREGRGPVVFGLTENGDVGLWVPGKESCEGIGCDAEAALVDAVDKAEQRRQTETAPQCELGNVRA